METVPVNQILRFGLELTAMYSFGAWGWRMGHGGFKFLLAIILPLIAMSVWAVLNVPGDPGGLGVALVPVPGLVRLILEFAIFSAAYIAIREAVLGRWAIIFALLVMLHYAMSMDRINWLMDHT